MHARCLIYNIGTSLLLHTHMHLPSSQVLHFPWMLTRAQGNKKTNNMCNKKAMFLFYCLDLSGKPTSERTLGGAPSRTCIESHALCIVENPWDISVPEIFFTSSIHYLSRELHRFMHPSKEGCLRLRASLR